MLTLQNDILVAQAAETIRNGTLIDWSYWARVEPNATQAARLAHSIDPIKWPDDVYAAGEIPADLREKIARLQGWIEQEWPFATITLGQLVGRLGDHATATLRAAAGPELEALKAQRDAIDAQENERRRAGRYFLEEVAEALAGEVEFDRWLQTITDAVMSGELPLCNPQNYRDKLPYSAPKELRTFYDQVHFDDVNRWLDKHPAWTDERLSGWKEDDDPRDTQQTTGAGALNKQQILIAAWPGNVNLQRALTDVPDWLKPARVSRGKAGRRSSTWNPAMIGICLCSKKAVTKKAIARHIATHFPEWLERWESSSEHLE